MIETLRVRNLAVIDALELELAPGLNVFTGETGAGKSVLLSAVALLCGRRVTSEAIRAGAEEARVEALLRDARLAARARELGPAVEGDELVVVRTLSRGGRGRAFVNGSLATVGVLHELLGDAIEVVSQGEHLRLLRPEAQGELVDAFGGVAPQAAAVAEAHARWHARAAELDERRTQAEERARREDQLRFELEQIERADPQPGELDALDREHARLAHVERLGEHGDRALDLLEGEDAARERVAAARAELRQAARLDSALAEVEEGLARAQVELDEAVRAVEEYRASLEADPQRLGQVEARQAQLGRLQSRYGSTVEAILAHRDEVSAELERLGGGEARTAELERDLADAEDALDAAAGALEKGRRQAATELESAVAAELRALDMRRAVFSVGFDALPRKSPEGWEAPSGPGGRERAAFRLAANPGDEPRRLRDAASGGELARLLLALRNALRESAPGGVLLFDEVDAGISGRTAARVGERLGRLARAHQVLCITHLPQIAALGATHYCVSKRVRRGHAEARVERLDRDARIDEIARMAGGGRGVTDVARAHARELLAQAVPER